MFGAWLTELKRDLMYAFRSLAGNWTFTGTAILTLALGIGLNTAIFSVINTTLLNPLPFRDAKDLVWVQGRLLPRSNTNVSFPDLVDYRAQSKAFDQIGAFSLFGGKHNWTIDGHARQLQGVMVTANFFDVLGVGPVLGRTFTSDDENATAPITVILSYRFWQQAYGGDMDVIGKTSKMDSSVVTIVGVMPPRLDFLRNTDIWFPAPVQSAPLQLRVSHRFIPIARLKAGYTIAQAQADVDVVASSLAAQYPTSNKNRAVLLQPVHEALVGQARPVLLIVFGAVGFVLLIACVNIASLLLARNTARTKEIAVRMALGARRSRIIRQLITETLALSFSAGVFALALGYMGMNAIRGFAPANIPRLREVSLDGNVLAFAATLSLLTAVISGFIPAWMASGANPQEGLRDNSRTGMSRFRHLFGSVLVVSEMTLALCLLIAASLLTQSLWKIVHSTPGFSSQGVLAADVILPQSTYADTAKRIAFVDRVLEGVRTLPGAVEAATISDLPLNGDYNDTYFQILEKPSQNQDRQDDEDIRITSPGYFRTLGMSVQRGRAFDIQDIDTKPHVIVVDQPFVNKYFPGEDPIGKHLMMYEGVPELVKCEIVGVVPGIRHYALQLPPRPTIYLPYTQWPGLAFHLVVKSSADPTVLAEPIQRIVTAQDPDLAVAAFRTMDQVVVESAAADRFVTILLSLFAGLAIFLAAAGVYGVFTHIVAQQTHDIGVRMALGAHPKRMLQMVMTQAIRLAAIGAVLGTAAAYFLMILIASQLYEVSPRSALTYLAATFILLLIAAGACFVPARRAMSVDPLVALRYE